MKVGDLKDLKYLPCVFASEDGMKSVIDGFYSMFDREVFDCIVSCGGYSDVIAGAIAEKMNHGVVKVQMDNRFCVKSLKSGWKVVIFADVLENGEMELDLIQKLEAEGCKVLKLGFIAEDTGAGARKSKILKKYPFESIIDL